MKKETKERYESPTFEVVVFNQEDSIATSGGGSALWEEIWGTLS